MPIQIVLGAKDYDDQKRHQAVVMPEAEVKVGNHNIAYLSTPQDMDSVLNLKIYRTDNDSETFDKSQKKSTTKKNEVGENYLGITEELKKVKKAKAKDVFNDNTTYGDKNKKFNSLLKHINILRSHVVSSSTEETQNILKEIRRVKIMESNSSSNADAMDSPRSLDETLEWAVSGDNLM